MFDGAIVAGPLLESGMSSMSPTRLIREVASCEKRSCMKVGVFIAMVVEVLAQEVCLVLAPVRQALRKLIGMSEQTNHTRLTRSWCKSKKEAFDRGSLVYQN